MFYIHILHTSICTTRHHILHNSMSTTRCAIVCKLDSLIFIYADVKHSREKLALNYREPVIFSTSSRSCLSPLHLFSSLLFSLPLQLSLFLQLFFLLLLQSSLLLQTLTLLKQKQKKLSRQNKPLHHHKRCPSFFVIPACFWSLTLSTYRYIWKALDTVENTLTIL